MKQVSALKVRELVAYDQVGGSTTWLDRPESMFPNARIFKSWNTKYAGQRCFTTHVRGYLAGAIFNRHVYAHRAAFAVMEGRWPESIDHINGIKNDNRWCNIREVTHVLNMRNLPMMSTNASGVTGVSFLEKRNKWTAQIGLNGSSVFLGQYDTKGEATIARAAAEKVLGFTGRAKIAELEAET